MINDITLDNPINSNDIKEKRDWKNVNWDEYSSAVESFIEPNITNLLLVEDPVKLWQWSNAALSRINNEHVPIKTISKHSKPYWNANLSLLSSEVRKTRKRYKYGSNEFNKRTLDQAKLRFSEALNTAQSNFIEHH